MLRTWRNLAIPILSLTLLTFGVAHIVKSARSEPRIAPPVVPPRSPYGATIAAAGVVEPQSENISVSSPLPGTILRTFVTQDDTGKAVKLGDPLYQVDDRHLLARLAEAEARLLGPQAQLARLDALPRQETVTPVVHQLESLRAEVVRATDEFTRYSRLMGSQAVSESQLVEARQAKIAAEAERDRVQAELDLLQAGAWEPDKVIARTEIGRIQAEINEIQTEIERSLVRAPIDGIILQVNVRAGEYVATPPTHDLVVLGDMRQPRVRVDIDESDIPRFRAGSRGVGIVRGNSEKKIPLQFVRIEPYIVPKTSLTGDNREKVDTRVLQVLYEVPTDGNPIYVGQQLDVFIDAHNELAAPATAAPDDSPVNRASSQPQPPETTNTTSPDATTEALR